MASIPVLRQAVPESTLCWQAVCICERAAALLFLTLALPVALISAFLVWISAKRTPLIAHRRIGRHGAPLWMLKLRTMWGGPEPADQRAGGGWIEYIDDDGGPDLKDENDARVPGRLPRFLRRHSIDEIPQLWHVISGEMSLVGPRPMTDRELRRHYGAQTGEVLLLRPGMTGLWQTSGRNRLSFDDRRRLDLKLVRDRSLGMYFGILWRTLPEIFRGQNTW